MQFQIPKGTFDILPYGVGEETWRLSHLWQHVERTAREIAARYNYLEVRTPLYERTELFDRGVGETSDIVSKEMFTFLDKGGRSISLRPEGTASVMRAFLENQLVSIAPVHKLFYIGPMFRYERPQSGRYRQHHQFGVEAIGVAGPELDAEVIDLLMQFYRRLGMSQLKVKVNSVGDLETREAYREALRAYFRPHFERLSADSQVRFEKNPLRILDSKDEGDKELVAHAPSILNYLTPGAKEHFQRLCTLLDELQVPYAVDDKIVRGLDYYHRTVFEVVSEDLGSQGTVGAGGRFDGLIDQMGGPNLPAVGCGTGLERVLQVLLAQKAPLPSPPGIAVYFIPLGEEARAKCLELTAFCRHAGIAADLELVAKKVGSALQNGERLGARFCAIIGSDEIARGTVQLKNLQTREQRQVPFGELLPALQM